MKKKKIQNIFIHTAESADSESIADKINNFYIDIVKRRIFADKYTKSQRIMAIDNLIAKIMR